jgi:hypothetical protein
MHFNRRFANKTSGASTGLPVVIQAEKSTINQFGAACWREGSVTPLFYGHTLSSFIILPGIAMIRVILSGCVRLILMISFFSGICQNFS